MIIEHYLQLVRYYRWLLLAIVGGITAAAAGLSGVLLVLFPIYTGTASVTMLPSEPELAFTKGWAQLSQLNPAATLIQTHMEYLMSTPVAERALAKVVANVPPKPPAEGWRAEIGEIVGEGKRRLRRIYNILNSGKHVPLSPHEAALQQLMDGIDIKPFEGSFILQIEVALPNPEAAAAAATALAEAHVERASEEVAVTARALQAYFQGQIDDREAALNDLDEREYGLRKRLGILSLVEERQSLLQAREAEHEKLVQDRIERAELEARLAAFEGKEGELQRRGVLAKVEEEIALSEANRRALEGREAIRLGAIESINAKLDALAEKEQPLLPLQRERAGLESDIADLRERMVTVNLAGSGQLSQVRIIDPATVPIYPSFPKVLLNTGIGFAGGVLVALFVLIVMDTVSGTVKTTADLRRLAGDRALGRLPRRLVDPMPPLGREFGRARLKQLEALGASLEPRLAALGDFDAPAIQVTGFGSPSLIAGTAVSIAGALSTRGLRVTCSLPDSNARFVSDDQVGSRSLQLFDDDPTGENPGSSPQRSLRVECLGPVSARFSWRAVTERSPALVCALESGNQFEETCQQFQAQAERNGVSAVSFILIQR